MNQNILWSIAMKTSNLRLYEYYDTSFCFAIRSLILPVDIAILMNDIHKMGFFFYTHSCTHSNTSATHVALLNFLLINVHLEIQLSFPKWATVYTAWYSMIWWWKFIHSRTTPLLHQNDLSMEHPLKTVVKADIGFSFDLLLVILLPDDWWRRINGGSQRWRQMRRWPEVTRKSLGDQKRENQSRVGEDFDRRRAHTDFTWKKIAGCQ